MAIYYLKDKAGNFVKTENGFLTINLDEVLIDPSSVKTIETQVQELQAQIDALNSASNFVTLWSGNWTNSDATAKSIDFTGYKYIIVKGSIGGNFSVMLPVAAATYGFALIAGSSRNTIYACNLTLTSSSIAWGVAGFYTDGVFQDRTNTGFYNIWEILGVK